MNVEATSLTASNTRDLPSTIDRLYPASADRYCTWESHVAGVATAIDMVDHWLLVHADCAAAGIGGGGLTRHSTIEVMGPPHRLHIVQRAACSGCLVVEVEAIVLKSILSRGEKQCQ